MATVILAPPLDDGSGTYATNADGSPVPFVVAGWVDAPGQLVSVYEDTTNALLVTATASSVPDAIPPRIGWYPWSATVTQWSTAAGALVPAAVVATGAGAVALSGGLALAAAAASSAGGALAFTSVEPRTLPAASATTSAGGVTPSASRDVLAASATSVAGSLAVAIGVPAASAASSAGAISAAADDATSPAISSFSVPANSGSTALTGISAGATDNVGVTAWIIKDVTENAAAPTATAAECTQTTGISAGSLSSSSLTYTASGTGARDCYLFVRDSAGNVTRSTKSTVTIAVASAPTFVAAGSFGTSPSLPTRQNGDLLVMIVCAGSQTVSGWTRQVNGVYYGLFTRISGSDSVPSLAAPGQIASFRSVNQTTPVPVIGTNTSGTTSITASQIDTTPAGDNALVLFAACGNATDSVDALAEVTIGTPSGPATTQAFKSKTAAGEGASAVALWYGVKASAGNTGSASVSATIVYNESRSLEGVLVALDPA